MLVKIILIIFLKSVVHVLHFLITKNYTPIMTENLNIQLEPVHKSGTWESKGVSWTVFTEDVNEDLMQQLEPHTFTLLKD